MSETASRIGIRVAGRGDVERLSVALAAAFHDDPVFGWLMPDARKRPARLRRFFGVELRRLVLVRGFAQTTDELSGAALTLPPGKWSSPPLVAALQGPPFGARMPSAGWLLAMMERRHLREPHYYLPYIGVAPRAQGRGLGTALMRPTLERCDAEGLPAYLEATSKRNALLYERLGFEHRGELRVGSSPPLMLMVRPRGS
jgi:ribosomal protein S18 acetylase RimI-like enzyme